MQAIAGAHNWEPLPDAGEHDTGPQAGALLGGRYRLDVEIGRGGMATVWRGHDVRLERDVAIKICRPSPSDCRPAFREEQVSSALLHGNIVSIFDAGDIPDGEPGAGSTYIVMEYVDGTTAHVIAPVGWRRAARIVRQAAEGLAAAHERGIVHCDVKPGNLLLDRNERVLVADFGVAVPAESDVGEFVHGSPAYLAPERLTGQRPDPRVDVYGLGGVLAYLLTGRRPDDDIVKHLPADCPEGLAELISRARAQDPARRHPDARAFQRALDDVIRLADRRSPRATTAPDDARTIQLATRPASPAPELSPRVSSPPGPARPAAPASDALVTRSARMAATSARAIRRNPPMARRPAFRPATQGARGTLVVAAILALLVALGGVLAIREIVAVPSVRTGAGPVSAATEMPDVRGETFGAAVEALAERNLVVERIEVVYGPGPLNQVVAQSPDPGTDIDEGEGVTLVVRTGR